jgi:hypothetical protein
MNDISGRIKLLLILAVPLIWAAIELFLTVDYQRLKNQESNPVTVTYFNPIAFASPQEILQTVNKVKETLPESPDCSVYPSQCMLLAIRVSQGHIPSEYDRLYPVPKSFVQPDIENSGMAMCTWGKRRQIYLFGEKEAAGDVVQTYLRTLSSFSRFSGTPPQFVGEKDPVVLAMSARFGNYGSQPELGAGFDKKPALAYFNYSNTRLWLGLHKTTSGYRILMVLAPLKPGC